MKIEHLESPRERSLQLLLVLPILALAGTVLLVYWPGLNGSWIFDDLHAITNNPDVQINQLTLKNLENAFTAFSGGLSGRGLAMVTFGIDHWLWDGEARGFKLTNLLIHTLNAILVFWLARAILLVTEKNTSLAKSVLQGAFCLALLWAIHPLQVSSVLYVVQRMEIMSVSFILIGLLMYIRGRHLQLAGAPSGWFWLIGSAGAAGFAFLTKETGALLPVFALCLEIALFQFSASKRTDRRLLISLYIAGAISALAIFLLHFLPQYLHPDAYSGRHFTIGERLLTQFRVLILYLGWILWPDPDRYQFFYDAYPVSTSWRHPWTTIPSAILLLGFAGLALCLRKRIPLFSLGILWFFTAHLLTSNVFSLELVFEHRNYFATFGVLLALAGLLSHLSLPRLLHLPARSSTTIVAIGFAVLTLIHSATWGDPLNLAMALKNKSPESARAGYQLGQEYLRMADGTSTSPFFSFAQAEFERARHLESASAMSERVLIELKARTGEAVQAELWDDLQRKVEDEPAGAENVKAVRDLLNIYNQGVGLDKNRLMDAGIALLNKPGNLPYNYWEFGLFALEEVEERGTALQLLEVGARRANDPIWNQQIVTVLKQRGHLEFSSTLARRLETSPKKMDLER